jgi:putative membrane protein
MEPVMVRQLGYWRWLEAGPLPGGAPFANFLGWFATATLAAAILLSTRPRLEQNDPVWVLAGHATLTLGLGAILAR